MSYLCPDCRGSGVVRVGRKKDGTVGIRPATFPDWHDLSYLRCRCGGKALVTFS